VLDRLAVSKWDLEKPAFYGNMICLTKKEFKKHHALKKEEWVSYYSLEFLKHVQSRFEKEQQLLKWRSNDYVIA
jgi:hypothetical protein